MIVMIVMTAMTVMTVTVAVVHVHDHHNDIQWDHQTEMFDAIDKLSHFEWTSMRICNHFIQLNGNVFIKLYLSVLYVF